MNHAQTSTEAIPEIVSSVSESNPHRGHGTILLVEDEARLREITCEILEAAGYRVLKARNALEAISIFNEYKAIVRLLVTDVVLPGQSGRDLANDLRSISAKLRVIFISGYPGVFIVRKTRSAIHRSFTRKPS
jgi:two-component system, cell cycle sensor histidine kinase and response regulator CckA